MVDGPTRQQLLEGLLRFELSGDNPELQARIDDQLRQFSEVRNFQFPDQTQLPLENIASEMLELGLEDDAERLMLLSESLPFAARMNLFLTNEDWGSVTALLDEGRANLVLHNVGEGREITPDFSDVSQLDSFELLELESDQRILAAIDTIQTAFSEELRPYLDPSRRADFYTGEASAESIEWALDSYGFIADDPTANEGLMDFGRSFYDAPERALDAFGFLADNSTGDEDFLMRSLAAYEAENGEGSFNAHIESLRDDVRSQIQYWQGIADDDPSSAISIDINSIVAELEADLEAINPDAILTDYGIENGVIATNQDFIDAAITDYEAIHGEGSWQTFVDTRREELRVAAEEDRGWLDFGEDNDLPAYQNFTPEALAVEWAMDGNIRTQMDIAETAIRNLNQNEEFLETARQNYDALHGEGAWAAHVDEELSPQLARLRAGLEAEIQNVISTFGEDSTHARELLEIYEAQLEELTIENFANTALADWATENLYARAGQMDWSNAETFGLDPSIFSNLDATELIGDEFMDHWNSDNPNVRQFAQAWLDASETLYNARNGEGAWDQHVAQRGWNDEEAMERLARFGESSVSWFENNVTSAGFTFLTAEPEEAVSLLYLLELNGFTDFEMGDLGDGIVRGVADPTLLLATTGTGYVAARFAARRAYMEAAENYMVRQVVANPIRAAAIAGTQGGAIEGMATEYTLGWIEQSLQIEHGMLEDYNYAELRTRAAFGGLFGAGLGAAMGAGGGALARMFSSRAISNNLSSHLTPDSTNAYRDFISLAQNAEELAQNPNAAQQADFQQAVSDILNYDASGASADELARINEIRVASLLHLRDVAEANGIDIAIPVPETFLDAPETGSVELDAPDAEQAAPELGDTIVTDALPEQDAETPPAVSSTPGVINFPPAGGAPAVGVNNPYAPGAGRYDRLVAQPPHEGTRGGGGISPEEALAQARARATPPALPDPPEIPGAWQNWNYLRRARFLEEDVQDPARIAAFLINLDSMPRYSHQPDELMTNNLISDEARDLFLANRAAPEAPAQPAPPRQPDVETVTPPPSVDAEPVRINVNGTEKDLFDLTVADLQHIAIDDLRGLNLRQMDEVNPAIWVAINENGQIKRFNPDQRNFIRNSMIEQAEINDAAARLNARPEPTPEPTPRTEGEGAAETVFTPGDSVIWANADNDVPARFVRTLGEGSDGRTYVRLERDGNEFNVPLDEVQADPATRTADADAGNPAPAGTGNGPNGGATPPPNAGGAREIRVGDETMALSGLTVNDVRNINPDDLKTITMDEMRTIDPSLWHAFSDQGLIGRFGREQQRFIRDTLGGREIRVDGSMVKLAEITPNQVKNINPDDLRTITMAEMRVMDRNLWPRVLDNNLIGHFNLQQRRFIREAIREDGPERSGLGQRVENVRDFFRYLRDDRVASRVASGNRKNLSRLGEWDREVANGRYSDGTLTPDAQAAQDNINLFLTETRVGQGPAPNLINVRRYDEAYDQAIANNQSADVIREAKADMDTAYELAARQVDRAVIDLRKGYPARGTVSDQANYLRNILEEYIDSFPPNRRDAAWRELLTREHTMLEVISGLAHSGGSTANARKVLGEVYSPLIRANDIPFLDDSTTPEITSMRRIQFVARKMSEMRNSYGTGTMNWRSGSKAVRHLYDTLERQSALRAEYKAKGNLTDDEISERIAKTIGKDVSAAFTVLLNSKASPNEIYWWARSARIKGLREILRTEIAEAPRGISKEARDQAALWEILYQAVSNDPVEGWPADPYRVSWSRELLAKTLTSIPERAWAAQRLLANVTGIRPTALGGDGRFHILPQVETRLGYINPLNWVNQTSPGRIARFLAYDIWGGHFIHSYPRGFESLGAKTLSRMAGLTGLAAAYTGVVDYAIDGEYDLLYSRTIGRVPAEVIMGAAEIPIWFYDVIGTNVVNNAVIQPINHVAGAETNYGIDFNGVDAISADLIFDPNARAETPPFSWFSGVGEDQRPGAPVIELDDDGIRTGAVNPAPPAPPAGSGDPPPPAGGDDTVVAGNGTGDDTPPPPAGSGDPPPAGGDDTVVAGNGTGDDTPPPPPAANPNAANRLAAARRRAASSYSTEEVVEAVLPGAPGRLVTDVGSQIELRRIWNTARGWFGDLGAIAGGLWNAMGNLPGPWGGIAQIGTALAGAMMGRNFLLGAWNLFTTGSNWRNFAITGGLAIGAMHAFNYFSGNSNERIETLTTSDYRSAHSGVGSHSVQRYNTDEVPVVRPAAETGAGQIGDQTGIHSPAGAEFATAQNLIRDLSAHSLAYEYAEAASGAAEARTLETPEGGFGIVDDMSVVTHDGVPMRLAAVEHVNPFTGRIERTWTASGELANEGVEQAAETGWQFVAAQQGANFQNVATMVGSTYAIAALDEDENPREARFLPAALLRGENSIVFDQSPHADAIAAIGWGETGTASGTGTLTPDTPDLQDTPTRAVNFADLAAEPDQPTGLA